MADSDHQRFLAFSTGGRPKQTGCMGPIKSIGEEYVCPAFTEKPVHKSLCGPPAARLGQLAHCSLARAGGKGQTGGGQMYTTTGRLTEKKCNCSQNGGSIRDAGIIRDGSNAVGYFPDVGGPHLANQAQYKQYGEPYGKGTGDDSAYDCKTPTWSPKCV